MMTGPKMVAFRRGDIFITTWRRTPHLIPIQCSRGGHCSHLVDTSRHSRTCDYSLYCRHFNDLLPSVSRCNSNKRLYLSLNLSCPIYRAVVLIGSALFCFSRTQPAFFFIFLLSLLRFPVQNPKSHHKPQRNIHATTIATQR